MKIIWASNYSAQSSYAIQTRMLVPRLKALGHDMIVFELSNGTRLPYQAGGVKILSVVQDPLGNDVIEDYALRSQAHAVITLMDVWRFDPNTWKQVAWFPYAPIDHTPVPPLVANALNAARKVIAMSQFGVQELKRADCEALYVPLCYDPAVWQYQEKADARARAGIPEQPFWVTFVGVNDSIPSRKGIPELLTAWQAFIEHHPDAVLYLHTSLHGNLAQSNIGGVKIDALLTSLRLTPNNVKIVDEYEYRTGVPHKKLATLMAASDVVILPSRGEGFGLPLIEAQAVGTPVITTKFAAQQELCKAGWLIEGESEWSYQDSFWLKPGILSILECLEVAYQRRKDNRLRQIAADSVRDYQVDNVVQKYWRPTLKTIAEMSLEALAS